MDRDAEAQARQHWTVDAKPLGPDRDRIVQYGRVVIEHRHDRSALGEVDDGFSEGLDRSALRTEDQHRVPVRDHRPSRCDAQFSLIAREEARLAPLGQSGCQEARHERFLCTDRDFELRMIATPFDLAVAQARWPPVHLDQSVVLIASQPRREILQLIAIGKDGR